MKLHRSDLLKQLTLLASITGCVSALQAANITWAGAQNTTGKSDLIEGTVVHAWSGGAAATITGGGASGSSNYNFSGVTYQNFTFAPTTVSTTFTDSTNPSASTGDANMDTLLRNLTYTTNGVTSGTQTIGGLTVGETYQIQVFYNDQRSSTSSRVMTYGDGTNTVNVSAGGGAGWGQYAIGSFTADATTQSLTHATNGFGNIHVNAILVNQTGPPPAPSVPTNLVATAGNNSNSLSWDVNNQVGFLQFRVKRSLTSGGPYTEIGTTNTNSYYDGSATNGTTYYYVVTKENTDNVESGVSNEASATPSSSIIGQPNFLFILVDDMDTYALNAYRTTEPAETDGAGLPYTIDTPNIDRLANEGMLFHQARFMGSWTGAVCTGSRTCMMTGTNTWRSLSNPSPAARTFPGIFNRGVKTGGADAPYATYRTCKSGNSYATANNEFTIVNDSTKRGNTDGNGSEWHRERSLEHIEHWRVNHRPAGKPFMMFLGFSHPHDERNARTTPDLVGRYNCVNTTTPGTVTLDPNAPPLPANHLPIAESTGIPANYPFHPFDHGHLGVRDDNTAPGILKYRTEAVVRNEIGRNFACVDWIDQQLGIVFAKLEDPNGDGDTSDSVMDNTYIVFTSDHGIAIGRHGLQGKQNLYEHSWKVPYLVRGPGIAAGTESDALIYLHDTFPTFCDLAGLDVPTTIDANDGQSFKDVLLGSTTDRRDYIYGVYAGGSKPGMRSVTDGRFKLIKYDVGANATQETQLFDLQTNPYELLPEHGTANLANQTAYASVRQRLEMELTSQRIENDDPYEMLGDRTLIRFEDGVAGQVAGVLTDSYPYGNDGTANSGNSSSLPIFSSDVYHATDFVMDEDNFLSLDFEQDNENYVEIPDNRALDFGNNPFTIEAIVKLETLPSGDNLASTMPVVMKKVTNVGDASMDYMFLAAAGNYGDATSYDKLALRLGTTTVISNLKIPDTTNWHCISVAFDPVSNTVRFTMDSLVDVQSSNAVGTRNNGPLIIGAHFNSSGVIDGAFDGLIDELSITDGFLDVAELQPLKPLITASDDFCIKLAVFSNAGSTINITFDSEDTRLYSIQRSYTLEAGSWVDLQTFVPGAGGLTETTVQVPVDNTKPKAFYRVRAE